MWSYSSDDCAFCISGSTSTINGRIITAHFIPSTAYHNTPNGNNSNDDYDDQDYVDSFENEDYFTEDQTSFKKRADAIYDDKGNLKHDATRNLALLQILKDQNIHLEIHQLNKRPSFVKSLVLPPASSGPGPYSIYARQCSSCIAVITTSGLVTLFSVPEFLPLPLSGLETNLNSQGLPLFDMSGRWLAYSPRNIPTPGISDTTASAAAAVATTAAVLEVDSNSQNQNQHQKQQQQSLSASALRTPLRLPPPGQLLDRILENISTTTASSLKSISDAGVSGLKHYLSNTPIGNSSVLASTTNDLKRQSNIIIIGNNKFNVDSSGRVALAFNPNINGANGNGEMFAGSNRNAAAAVMTTIPAALSNLFNPNINSVPIQVIDLETQLPICTFTPPQGVSYLSLSPYDSVLATVSSKGDSIYTFDLTFVPYHVSLNGKYVRGVTPAKVSQIEWDSDGGFGIITKDKGTVHWFERQPWNAFESAGSLGIQKAISISSMESESKATHNRFSNYKIWKLSGWRIESMILAPEYIGSEKDPRQREIPSPQPSPGPEELDETDIPGLLRSLDGPRYNKVLMLREGQLFVVDVATGTTSWKYDLPWNPVADSFLTPEIGIELIKNGKAPSMNVKSKIHIPAEDTRQQLLHKVEPLAFFELEPCLPYAYIHTDRHIILATYDSEEDEEELNSETEDNEPVMFGVSINSKELDFGRAHGQVYTNKAGHSKQGFESDEDYDEYGSDRNEFDEAVMKDLDLRPNGAKSDSPNMEWSPSKAAELHHAMQSMVVFDSEDDEDELLIVP